jgi:hypothetical protein
MIPWLDDEVGGMGGTPQGVAPLISTQAFLQVDLGFLSAEHERKPVCPVSLSSRER